MERRDPSEKVTPPERSTEPLRATDQGLLALWDLAADPMVLSDPHGVAVMANPAYYALVGDRPDEIIGHSMMRIFPPERRAELARQYRSLFQGETVPPAFEWVIRRPDGTERIAEARMNFLTQHGQRAFVLATIRDITQRKQAEAALQAERDQLQQIVDALPAGLLIADTDGRFVVTNPAAQDIFGHDLTGHRASAGEEGVFRLRHGDQAPYAPAELPVYRALARGETVRGEEMNLLKARTGREISLLVNAAPLRDSGGRTTRAVVVFQDISALRALERLREEWTSVIAHDLRQPLTLMLGYSTLLRQLPGQPKGRAREGQVVEQVIASTLRLSKMIDELVDSSRIETRRLTLQRRMLDLPVLLREVVDRLGPRTGGHAIRLAVAGVGRPIAVDPGRFEQALGNLLSNAVKFSFPRSPIEVMVEQGTDDIAVTVTNEGHGIAPEEVPRLFGRFHRAQQPRAGDASSLGLGLYITKGIIELHGGRIWVESIPEQTTAFHFTLPYALDREPRG